MKSLSKSYGIAISTMVFAVVGVDVMAQNVGVGTNAPAEKLHVVGTGRITSLAGVGNRSVLADPNGTLIIGTTANSPDWTILGNSGTSPATNFLGTLDNADMVIRRNNIERVRVRTNAFEFQGALEPNTDPGVSGEILRSNGPGVPPTWEMQNLNPTQILSWGKFFINTVTYNNNTTTVLTVGDANCTPSSTLTQTWVGALPVNPNYGLLEFTVEAQPGQWRFWITNTTGFNLINFSFSFVAWYGP